MTVRSIAIAFCLALLTPAVAAAQSRRPAAPPPAAGSSSTRPDGIDFAVLAGGEWGGSGYGALRLRGDAELDLRRELAPGFRLGGVLSIGLSRYSSDFGMVDPYGGTAMNAHSSATSLDVVPALRVHFAPAPRFDLYGDAGLGLGYTSASYEVTGVGAGGAYAVAGGFGSGVFVMARLGAGGFYQVDDRLKVGAELLGLNLRAGSGVGSSYSLLAAVAYRL